MRHEQRGRKTGRNARKNKRNSYRAQLLRGLSGLLLAAALSLGGLGVVHHLNSQSKNDEKEKTKLSSRVSIDSGSLERLRIHDVKAMLELVWAPVEFEIPVFTGLNLEHDRRLKRILELDKRSKSGDISDQEIQNLISEWIDVLRTFSPNTSIDTFKEMNKLVSALMRLRNHYASQGLIFIPNLVEVRSSEGLIFLPGVHVLEVVVSAQVRYNSYKNQQFKYQILSTQPLTSTYHPGLDAYGYTVMGTVVINKEAFKISVAGLQEAHQLALQRVSSLGIQLDKNSPSYIFLPDPAKANFTSQIRFYELIQMAVAVNLRNAPMNQQIMGQTILHELQHVLQQRVPEVRNELYSMVTENNNPLIFQVQLSGARELAARIEEYHKSANPLLPLFRDVTYLLVISQLTSIPPEQLGSCMAADSYIEFIGKEIMESDPKIAKIAQHYGPNAEEAALLIVLGLRDHSSRLDKACERVYLDWQGKNIEIFRQVWERYK